MTNRAAIILHDALELEEGERAQVAEALWESLETSMEPSLDAEWRQEVAARIAALDGGEAELTPWDEVLAGLQATLSGRRAS
jgi:putative addiction module component (TIGR02574 family)